MIYFVDEEAFQMSPFATELRLRGYKVKFLKDADIALRVLENAEDIELVIIDVMLAPDQEAESKFSRNETEDFLQTGLLLLRYLIEFRGQEFGKKCLFFSMANQPNLVAEIKKVARMYSIPYCAKKDYSKPWVFADVVEGLIKGGV